MNVSQEWIKILCFLSMLGLTYANIDSKEHFCGKKLVRTLTELCSIYNGPTFGRNRFTRQIVEECCRTECSRRYLIQYYCSKVSNEVAAFLKVEDERLKKQSQSETKKSEESSLEQQNILTIVGSTEESASNKKALSPKPDSNPSNHDRKTNGKRNCNCRKRRAKRIKKGGKLRPSRNMVPPPKIGHVEHSQRPFYVWGFSRSYRR